MAKKTDFDQDGEFGIVESDKEVVRVYELSFHIDPEKTESEAGKMFDALVAVASKNGTLVAKGSPEKIQLAYTISRTEQSTRQDFDSSYFGWIAYEANGVGHATVVEAVKEERNIFRFLDIKTTVEEAKHAEEMHELRIEEAKKLALMQEEAPEEEVAPDAELDAVLKEVTGETV